MLDAWFLVVLLLAGDEEKASESRAWIPSDQCRPKAGGGKCRQGSLAVQDKVVASRGDLATPLLTGGPRSPELGAFRGEDRGTWTGLDSWRDATDLWTMCTNLASR